MSAILLVVVFAFVAFTIDVGQLAMTKGELQNAADSASMAGVVALGDGAPAAIALAEEYANRNRAAGTPIAATETDVLIGTFNFTTKAFVESAVAPNAIRVTTHVRDKAFFFAPVIGHQRFDSHATATAMLNPRDIVFVVDLSGSMNDDTEPLWATRTINGIYAGAGYPNVATPLVQDLYTDLGFGSYPGTLQHIGQSLGVPKDDKAFAEMTKDDGALADLTIPAQYRIETTDSELTRRVKGYSWIIDYQIAVLMPNALPTPNSTTNYGYWEKYIDYVIDRESVGYDPPEPPVPEDPPEGGGGGGGGGEPPQEPPQEPPPEPPLGRYVPESAVSRPVVAVHVPQRQPRIAASYGLAGSLATSVAGLVTGYIPYTTNNTEPGVPRRGVMDEVRVPCNYDGDCYEDFNNPNVYTFYNPDWIDWTDMNRAENKIGYKTYVQFLLDFGSERSPDADNNNNANPAVGTKTQLSVLSPYCAYHAEATPGGTFNFPPREQPMHACRRALIAALQVVKERNGSLASGTGDRVAIVTFHGLDADHQPAIVQSLTGNYVSAMEACTTLQAVSDIGATTAIEAGLIMARNHLKLPADGGMGRSYAKKVVILLTDGVPNAWQTPNSDINSYIGLNPNGDYYASGYYWLNSALMQSTQIEGENTALYPVGIGLGTDYNFMDRMSRMAGTDESGQSPRGSGNPAEYEERLSDIFEEIVKNPGGKLVE